MLQINIPGYWPTPLREIEPASIAETNPVLIGLFVLVGLGILAGVALAVIFVRRQLAARRPAEVATSVAPARGKHADTCAAEADLSPRLLTAGFVGRHN